MLSYNNDPEFKQRRIDDAIAHRKADEFIAGEYGRLNGGFKGCHIGCLSYDIAKEQGKDVRAINFNDHNFVAENLGIPLFITRVGETIFEGTDGDPEFTERLLQAIPVGKDLTRALPKFLLKVLDLLPETHRKDVVDSIQGVREVLIAWGEMGKPDARAAARAAWAAAEAAARAARAAEWAAEWAARAAAWAARAARAAWAAARAAWAAARAAAEAAAWTQIEQALIEAINEC